MPSPAAIAAIEDDELEIIAVNPPPERVFGRLIPPDLQGLELNIRSRKLLRQNIGYRRPSIRRFLLKILLLRACFQMFFSPLYKVVSSLFSVDFKRRCPAPSLLV